MTKLHFLNHVRLGIEGGTKGDSWIFLGGGNRIESVGRLGLREVKLEGLVRGGGMNRLRDR